MRPEGNVRKMRLEGADATRSREAKRQKADLRALRRMDRYQRARTTNDCLDRWVAWDKGRAA